MIKIFLALWFMCFGESAWALLLSPDMGIHAPASLVGQLQVLRDESGQLRIEDVTASGKTADFVTLTGDLSAGYTPDVYWLRFTLQRTAETPADWFIEVAPSYLDEVTLFVPSSDGTLTATHLGDLHPYAQRPIPFRHFVFPLRLADEQPLTLYLRLQTTSTMLAQVKVWQYAGLLAEAQTDSSLYSVYFGILALAFVSNLVFWLRLRERLYLTYCAYLAALTLVMMATGGFLSQLLLPQRPVVASHMVGVAVSLVYLFGTHFFINVLHLRDHSPRLYRAYCGAVGFYAVCALMAAAGHYGIVAPWLMRSALMTTFGLSLVGPWLLWRGHRQYLFYILAFSVNFAAVPLITMTLLVWVSMPFSPDAISGMGSVLHIVLLNFAIVDRLRQSEKKVLAAVKETAALAAEREAARQQRQFVAMVSHEFRTPLAVIDATAQSVEIACSQSANAAYEFIAPRQEKIRRAVRRMVSLLDNFLTHERLDFKESKSQPEAADLRELASEAASNWSHLLHRPDQLHLALGQEAMPVWIERSMVALALSNLIDNALKYAPPGSKVTVRVGKTAANGWIEIEDQGIGVEAKEMALIFDKFYRSGNAQRMPGAGLGLYLVRTIAHSQGGEIDVESHPGQGSRFRLRLPLVK